MWGLHRVKWGLWKRKTEATTWEFRLSGLRFPKYRYLIGDPHHKDSNILRWVPFFRETTIAGGSQSLGLMVEEFRF